MTKLVLRLLAFYRSAISPALPDRCRFTPTCSDYTAQAISRFGLAKGSYLGLRRLLRCHPWHRGGHDPVPEAVGVNSRARSSQPAGAVVSHSAAVLPGRRAV
ncbi:hypothetical protein SAMN05444157_0401 [Frankineae bacterium MT45]|nr:hypothetical protein SAMN05444157_0401 [Frankineae bacterium MT45]